MKANIPDRATLGVVLVLLGLTACGHSPDHVPLASSPESFFDGLIGLYQGPLNHLAAVRRGSCPMYPSCSEYSRQAMAKHGPIMGWILTADRLMRCGRDEMRTAPRIWADGSWKFYDPVEANDFWWQSTPGSSSPGALDLSEGMPGDPGIPSSRTSLPDMGTDRP